MPTLLVLLTREEHTTVEKRPLWNIWSWDVHAHDICTSSAAPRCPSWRCSWRVWGRHEMLTHRSLNPSCLTHSKNLSTLHIYTEMCVIYVYIYCICIYIYIYSRRSMLIYMYIYIYICIFVFVNSNIAWGDRVAARAYCNTVWSATGLPMLETWSARSRGCTAANVRIWSAPTPRVGAGSCLACFTQG